MTKSKNTKRALFVSVLSIMLCMAMLVGTTFAWFTDSVTSGKNKIVAGNLDIELEYCTDPSAENAEWKDVQGTEDLFGDIALWEPGTTGVVYFRLSNLGTLALKYKLAMNFTDTVIGKNADGGDIKLSEVLEFGIVEGQQEKFANREAAMEAVSSSKKLSEGYTDEKSMGVTDDKTYFALVVYMPTTTGNEANYRGNDIPQVDLGVTLIATQTPYEDDSFGKDYDKGIWIGGIDTTWYDVNENEYTIDTPDKFAGFAKLVNDRTDFNGKTIILGQDINLNNVAFTPVGSKKEEIYFNGTFDGNNKVISGLNVTSGDYVALFGAIKDATVKNLTVKGSVSGENAAGIVARMESGTIENCVSYVNVISGAKAGGIVCLTNKGGCNIASCTNYGTVNGGTAGTTGGTGGIVAYANPNTVITDCNNYGNIGTTADKYSGGIVGYGTQSNSTVSDCVNYGAIVANNAAGGVAGMTTNSWDIINCINEGKIDSEVHGGGIAGAMQNGKAENCKNTAPVNGKIAGGIVGVTNGAVEIINCSGGAAQITSPAWTLGFTGHALTVDLKDNEGAGRLIGANGGGGSQSWTKLIIDDNNGDDTNLGAVGICGPYTTWANLEIISGTFYGDPVAGNTTYIKLDEGAVWADRTPGTYSCGGVTEAIRKNEWTKIG